MTLRIISVSRIHWARDKNTTEGNTFASYYGELSDFPVRQAWRFQLPYYKLSVPEKQNPIFALLWRFSSHNSYHTPGLAYLMNVLFWGWCDFPISFFGGDMSTNIWNRFWKFYGRYGNLIKQYEVPLSILLHDILEDDYIEWDPPLIRHYTNFWPCYWTWSYYQIWLFLPNCARFP